VAPPVPGDIFRIPLDGKASFGRVLEGQDWAFYEGLHDQTPSLEKIAAQKVIFRIWVASGALKSGRWEIVGNLPLEGALRMP
jgi:hypothetical protein